MNVAVTNVSRIAFDRVKHNLMPRDYVDQELNQFHGVMTNEAPLKSLIKRLKGCGEELGRIIYIESDDVRTTKSIPDYGMLSDADFLRLLINNSAEGPYPLYDSQKDSIRIADEPDESAVSETVFAVYRRMLELYEESQQSGDKELNVYIEANGGIRYVLTMLLSIMRTLENSLEHFHIKEITSMVLNQNPVKISDTKAIYDTTQITGIIDEYINYGRISNLEKYAESLFADAEPDIKKSVEQIMQKLAKLADDIQLCRTRMMLDDFYLDGGIGKEIDTFFEEHKDYDDAAIRIFNYILQHIKEEYDKVIYKGYKQTPNNIIYLPKVIEWCLKKDFIQQALTLSSERIPEYLFKTGKLTLSDEMQALLDASKTDPYEPSYYFMAHLKQDFLSKMDNAKIKMVLDSIHEMDRNHSLLTEDKWMNIEIELPLTCSGELPLSLSSVKERVYDLALEYMNLSYSSIGEIRIKRLLSDNGFDENILERSVQLSNKIKTKLINAFQGYYIDKNGEIKSHCKLERKADRLVVILPELVRYALPTQQGMEEYSKIIDEIFTDEPDSFKDALKEKYSEKQSDKYYIREAMLPSFGHIRTNMAGGADDLQRILYLFSMCKEQRNLSNHAHVSDDDRKVAMDSRQLEHLIKTLLEACEADHNNH